MVDRFEKFSFAISEITRYWHKITAEEMQKYDLKGPYAVYFTTMYRYREGITSVKLAELCSRDKADVSRAISLLEKKGLIEKEKINRNLYKALIHLTDKGKEVAEHINEKAQKAVEYVGKDMNEESRKVFYDCLESIVSNLQILSRQGISCEHI